MIDRDKLKAKIRALREMTSAAGDVTLGHGVTSGAHGAGQIGAGPKLLESSNG